MGVVYILCDILSFANGVSLCRVSLCFSFTFDVVVVCRGDGFPAALATLPSALYLLRGTMCSAFH
jgi:hypothetical protein